MLPLICLPGTARGLDEAASIKKSGIDLVDVVSSTESSTPVLSDSSADVGVEDKYYLQFVAEMKKKQEAEKAAAALVAAAAAEGEPKGRP